MPRTRLGSITASLLLTLAAIEGSKDVDGAADKSQLGLGNKTNAGPPIPYHDEGACPHEGCKYGLWWVEEDTSVRKEMDSTSEVIFTAKKGAVVECWYGVVVVKKPVRFQVPKPLEHDRVKIPAGGIVYLLTPQGEGFHLAWYEGELLSGFNPWDFSSEVEEVDYEWWVQVESERGEIGWALEDGQFATDTVSTTFYPFRDGAVPRVLGQWDFDQGDLRATHGQDLEYRDGPGGQTQKLTRFGSTRDFEISEINGQPAKIMRFPSCRRSMGYKVFHRAEADPFREDAWHTRVNEYTLIMDILLPRDSYQERIALFQTDVGNSSNAELFLVSKWIRGRGNEICFPVQPEEWLRIAWVVKKKSERERETELRGTINGQEIARIVVGEAWDPDHLGFDNVGAARNWSLEPRRSLFPYFLLFTDNDHETGPAYVNSIQFRSYPMKPEQVEALGGPTAAGIPVDVSVDQFGICEGGPVPH